MNLGLNEWYYHLDYHSSSMQWTATVQEYPEILTAADGSRFRGFNELSPEYTKGYENKLALYFTDDWQINPKLNLFYGGRLEYYRMSADQISHPRYSGFYIGDTAPDGTVITPANVTKDKLNYAATARVTYNMIKGFGLTADGTIATRFPRINEYAGTGPTEEQYNRVTIPLVRGGLFYKNSWLDLTSMVTYIAKSNNIDQQNLTKPGTSEGKTVLLIYDIQTLGWTTSAEIDPFKGFHLHALFTYQKPVYKNYNANVTFSDGSQMGVNANNMIVKEIPQVLVELDPSYNITKDLRLLWKNIRQPSGSSLLQRTLGNIRRYQLDCKQELRPRSDSSKLPEPEGSQRNYQRFGTYHQGRSFKICRMLHERYISPSVHSRIQRKYKILKS